MKIKFYINNIIKVIIFSINFLYNDITLFSKFSNFISYLTFSKEIKEIENYLKICEKQKNIKNFEESDDIKISIIYLKC